MKTCSKCKITKEVSEFYRDKRSTDGLRCQCKECMVAYGKTISARIAQQKYRDTEQWKESQRIAHRKYYQTRKGKLAIKKQYVWRKRTGRKRIYALVANNFEKGPCEICGSIYKVQAHHDDYSRPLQVRWLCAKHHMHLHKPRQQLERAPTHADT